MLRRSSLLRAGFLAVSLAGLGACGKDGTGPSNQTTQLVITNSTSVSVWYVRVRACGTETWGADLLGADVLSAGETESFTVTPGCTDVKLSTEGSAAEKIWTDVSLSPGQTVNRTITDWQ